MDNNSSSRFVRQRSPLLSLAIKKPKFEEQPSTSKDGAAGNNSNCTSTALSNQIEMEETDWGDDVDDLALIECTQSVMEEHARVARNDLNFSCEELINAQDMRRAIEERVNQQDQANLKLQRILSQYTVDDIEGMVSKMQTLEQRNEVLQLENYGHQGEITLLRRSMNKLSTARQMDLLNKMQEDLRIKADEREAKKKENAEMESLKSKLRFTTIELESMRQRMRENKTFSARDKYLTTKAFSPESTLSTFCSPGKSNKPVPALQTWSSSIGKFTPTGKVKVEEKQIQTDNIKLARHNDRERIKYYTTKRCTQDLSKFLAHKLRSEFDADSIEINVDTTSQSYDQYDELNQTFTKSSFALNYDWISFVMESYMLELEQMNDEIATLISLEQARITHLTLEEARTIRLTLARAGTTHLTIEEARIALELIGQGRTSRTGLELSLTPLKFDRTDKQRINILHSHGVQMVTLFVTSEISEVMESFSRTSDLPTDVCLTLHKLVNWMEHLIWAVINGVENTNDWSKQLQSWVSQMIFTIWKTIENNFPCSNTLLSLRLKCLRVLRAVMVKGIYEPASNNYDMLVKIIMDTCNQDHFRSFKYISCAMDILNAMAANERIFDYLCTDKTEQDFRCLAGIIAKCVSDIFEKETSISKKLILFECYITLSCTIHRPSNSEIIKKQPSDLIDEGSCTVLPWLASCLWEDKSSKKCQCRKTFCGSGIQMLGGVWQCWVAQFRKQSGLVPAANFKGRDDDVIRDLRGQNVGLFARGTDKMPKHEDAFHVITWCVPNKENKETQTSVIQQLNIHYLELMLNKFKKTESTKVFTEEEVQWRSNLYRVLHNEQKSVVKPENTTISIIEETLYQGFIFLEDITTYTYSLSLAFGTLGYVAFMESISHYDVFYTELPMIKEQVTAERLMYLNELEGSSDENEIQTNNDENEIQTNNAENDDADDSDDEVSDTEIQLLKEQLIPFTDSNWPPKLKLLQQIENQPEVKLPPICLERASEKVKSFSDCTSVQGMTEASILRVAEII